MYAYLPQVARPELSRNVKTSMLDVSNVEDYTRTPLAERRREVEGDHDHGVYLAPRESRHIEGDKDRANQRSSASHFRICSALCRYRLRPGG